MNYYNYFTEIEETFIRRRARNLFLSPIDWALMETWQERGIPLHIAIRAIEHVFDGFDKNPGPRTIKGLMFCREEVEAQYEEWVKSQAGKNDESKSIESGFSIDEIGEHIDGLIAALRLNTNRELAEDIDRACVRLGEIKANLTSNMEQLDKSLSDVEDLLEDALLKRFDAERLKEIEKDIASQMRPYKSTMEKAAYESTSRLMILKRLREEENIPRLSLFYL